MRGERPLLLLGIRKERAFEIIPTLVRAVALSRTTGSGSHVSGEGIYERVYGTQRPFARRRARRSTWVVLTTASLC